MPYSVTPGAIDMDLATVDDDSVFTDQESGNLDSLAENQGLADDADSCATAQTLVDDADSCSLAQTLGSADDLTITGTDTSGGIWTAPIAPSTMLLTSVGDDQLVTATITGFSDIAGTVADSEVIAMPDSTTKNTTKKFGQITQIALDAATAGDVSVGHLARDFDIDGIDTAAGTWTAPIAPSTILLTAVGDEQLVTATITGFSDIAGTVADSEVIALPDTTTKNSTKKFGQITNIAIDDILSADVSVGHLARDFDLDGTDTTAGVWTTPTGEAENIVLTSAADESLRDATVNGFSDLAQTSAVSESISLVDTGQVTTTANLAVVTGVEYDGVTTGNVKIGYVDDSFTLNGADVTDGVWTSPDGFPHQLVLTAAANETGKTVTVVGFYDIAKNYPATITIAAPNATTVETTAYMAVVTSATIDSAPLGNLKLGFVDEAIEVLMLDDVSSDTTLQYIVTGTVNFDIQVTSDPINKRNAKFPFTQTVDPTNWNWISVTAGASATATTSLSTPYTAIRLLINSYSTGAAVNLTVIQSVVN